MTNVIKFYRKNVYGNEMVYVADETQAEAIRCISGKTTLSAYAREGLEMLGFTFEEVLPPQKESK